ncbi:MAG TPA: Rieske (2Fe-2S) protein [Gemmatimonadales bacterium]|nr:Rieske (2Fe-2S) protein [Gemmatimonadales bacterium]
MNRREFLERTERLAAGMLACSAGLSLGGCIGFHYVNTSVSGNRLMIRRADFGSGRFALVDAPGLQLPLYVYRSDDGEFSAVSTRCMHRGCQVEPAAEHLVCPCHGSEYGNTGEVLKGPTQQPLRRLPVSVEGDTIAIELPVTSSGW